jgi:recombination protein RecT
MTNTNIVTREKPKFSVAIQSDMYKNLINNTLGDPERAKRFIASISSAVATTPALQECEAGSIVSGALLGEALNLSPSPQLGQMYLLPFNNTKKGVKEAQFVLGAKGYKQLAIRSGQYKDIDFIEVREGEYLGRDENTGKQQFKFISDDEVRENKPIIGYLAYFELLNGFRKQIYWSKTKMERHADKYSKAFNLADYKKLQAGQIPEKDLWKYSSYWYADFDGMAEKTLYRQLISKYGIMSIEMQDAYAKDMAVLHENGNYEYVDNPSEEEPEIIPPKTVKLSEVE